MPDRLNMGQPASYVFVFVCWALLKTRTKLEAALYLLSTNDAIQKTEYCIVPHGNVLFTSLSQ